MIVVVDDEEIYRELLSETLEPAGFTVTAFASALTALEQLEQMEPRLIISDIEMPEMNGLEFHRRYQQCYAFRHTPFVFLSSHSDSETIIASLEGGADDYLQKPLQPEIIRAKITSILKRRDKYITQQFSGSLEQMPFTQILQFCEARQLTGWVKVATGDGDIRVEFIGGEVQDNDDIDTLFDMDAGDFTISVAPVNYSEISSASVGGATAQQPATRTSDEKPMGKLSGIKVNKRIFQVQTEFSDNKAEPVVTVVILDGRVVLKRTSAVAASDDKTAIEQQIEAQHLSVEEEIRDKLASLGGGSTAPAQQENPDNFHQLYDAGYEQYCCGNYAAALDLWEQAEKLNPDDKTLAINLTVVRNKLGAAT